MKFTIRIANIHDRADVDELLRASKLAPLDETSQFGEQYAVACDEHDRVIGVAGFERYGDVALLRSVAVAGRSRAQGIGRTLALNRLEWATNAGIRSFYLLTNDAADYWQRFGFTTILRTDAPQEIRETTEWRGACPASAVAMLRRLSDV